MSANCRVTDVASGKAKEQVKVESSVTVVVRTVEVEVGFVTPSVNWWVIRNCNA